MQLVIDIPEHHYNNIMAFSSVNLGRVPYKGIVAYAINAIKNGTPLPKGHGKIIDTSELLTVTDIREDGSEFIYIPYSEIENALTIIEADRMDREEVTKWRSYMQKPPLGLMPRKIWNIQRAGDIFEAVCRYSKAQKPIPLEWIEELEDIFRSQLEKDRGKQ